MPVQETTVPGKSAPAARAASLSSRMRTAPWISPLTSIAPPAPTTTGLIAAVVVLAAIYFGRDVLVPIAIAVLLSFILAPLVRLLEGWSFPPVGAVIIVTLCAFLTMVAVG